MKPVPFEVVLILSTLLDAGVAAAALFRWPRRSRGNHPSTDALGLDRVLVAAIVAGAVFLAKAVALSPRVGLFGLICLTYVDLVVLVPALGLVLLLFYRRRATTAVKLLACLSLLGIPTGLYATFIEPFRLQLERAKVTVAPQRGGQSPVRVAILADIQTNRITDYERRAVQRVLELQPDIILMPGDLFQGTATQFQRQLPALRDLLQPLSAPAGVYYTLGNIDHREFVELATDGTQIELLVNRIVETRIGDRRITVGGIALDYRSPQARRLIEQMQRPSEKADIRILMAHLPDPVLTMAGNSRIDVLVAGHTHGGQVVLPLLGPPLTLSRVPRHVAAGGLHKINGQQIYVSRGVGCERGYAPRVRFACPPEITLLELDG